MGYPLVVLISGQGSNLQALIDRIQAGGIPAKIEAVISNRPQAPGLDRARRAGIPALDLDHRRHADRAAFDQALIAEIDRYQPKLVVLAGYMRILTGDFVRHYAGRLLNVHPSLLPDYRGLDTHARVLAAGETYHGTTVHYVSEELDGGPLIAQARLRVLPADTVDTLAARVQAMEHRLYPHVVKLIAEGRVSLREGGVKCDGACLTQPMHFEEDTIPAC